MLRGFVPSNHLGLAQEEHDDAVAGEVREQSLGGGVSIWGHSGEGNTVAIATAS